MTYVLLYLLLHTLSGLSGVYLLGVMDGNCKMRDAPLFLVFITGPIGVFSVLVTMIISNHFGILSYVYNKGLKK